jgi:hypothetical protein
MRRLLRPLGLAVALLAALPALAADPELSDKEKLERILTDMKSVKSDLEKLATVAVQMQATTRDLRDLERRMEVLEQAMERLSASRVRVSSSFTPSEPATGTIRIQNRFGVPATVFVNGQQYPVPAYETRRIAGVPAGNFTYEVHADGYGVIQPAVPRSLNARETFSIFINPPAPQLLLAP